MKTIVKDYYRRCSRKDGKTQKDQKSKMTRYKLSMVRSTRTSDAFERRLYCVGGRSLQYQLQVAKASLAAFDAE